MEGIVEERYIDRRQSSLWSDTDEVVEKMNNTNWEKLRGIYLCVYALGESCRIKREG